MNNKRLFIACPISKYLTEDGINKDFEKFIKELVKLCRKHFKEVYIALEREEYGNKKMYGSICTILDFRKIETIDVLLAIPEDSMGASIEIGWASALEKEVIVVTDKKFKQSELVKSINCITNGVTINIDSSNGYSKEKNILFKKLEEYFRNN